jgi:hypothetical protein
VGKRSDFTRVPRDRYPTPLAAVKPLLPHLFKHERFCEPCAGAGDLILHLEMAGHDCVEACDIAPPRQRDTRIVRADARAHRLRRKCSAVITNPPWSRELLHPIIDNLAAQVPCWFLLDSDWAHTVQAAPYWPRCSMMVSVGRVKWIPDSPFTGLDNASWYLFEPGHFTGPRFVGRERPA